MPFSASAFALVLANAVPLIGVVVLGWQVFPLVLLYWLENVVVGGFNVLRMLCARPRDGVRWAAKAFLVPFFIVHFGMFTATHGLFVFTLFDEGPRLQGFFPRPGEVLAAIQRTGVGLAVLALVASHGFSFVRNYLVAGEYRRASLQQLMHQPYHRVVILHLTILGGGFVTLLLKSPLAALVILVALKTAVDLRAHLAERSRFGGELAPEPVA